MDNLLQAALDYAKLGWSVFPCVAGRKTPLTKHGVKDATTDEQKIREWWSTFPSANIAVACGPKSGIYVIDIDVSEDGSISGIETLEQFPGLPETVKQNTPRGGFHSFFRSGDSPANKNSLRPGIDIRGDGYYVILAPSIHPNGGKYKWAEGCSPWECEFAEYPDFMRPETKEKSHEFNVPDGIKRRVPETTEYRQETQQSSGETLEKSKEDSERTRNRASAYLAECDPAIQGLGGHDKLLYAASRMVCGFNLPDSDAYGLLSNEYNPRCSPPWDLTDKEDEKDFRRKITEARRLATPSSFGKLLDEYSHDCADVRIDIDSLLRNSNTKKHTELRGPDHGGTDTNSTSIGGTEGTVEIGQSGDIVQSNETCTKPACIARADSRDAEAQELDYLCHPTGFVGELCSWINTRALRQQPLLALASSLTFAGALFGRKIRDYMGSRSNLYCMGITESSGGKQHTVQAFRDLAMETGIIKMLGGDTIASDSAIEERISEVPATLFLWDEVGHLLSHIRSGSNKNYAQVVALLMKLYSSASSVYLGREYAEKDRQRTIIQPCCCIYGTSTPQKFASGIAPEELQDGWLSRCLVFYSQTFPDKNRSKSRNISTPSSIIETVLKWKDFQPGDGPNNYAKYATEYATAKPPEQLVIPTTDRADAVFVQFDNDTRKFGCANPMLACLWAKGEENARRVALIIAAGNRFCSPEINERDAEYACRLVTYLMNSFSVNIVPEIASNETERNKRLLFHIIKTGGATGMTLHEVTRRTRGFNKRQRMEYVDDLLGAQDITPDTTGKIVRYVANG